MAQQNEYPKGSKISYIYSKNSKNNDYSVTNHKNLDQTFIQISEEKLRLILQKLEQHTEYSKSIWPNVWTAISIMSLLGTASFNEDILPKNCLQYVFGTFLSFVLYKIGKDIFSLINNKNDLETTICEIKNINNNKEDDQLTKNIKWNKIKSIIYSFFILLIISLMIFLSFIKNSIYKSNNEYSEKINELKIKVEQLTK